jgi:2'-5' RNA ligase
MRLFAAIVPPRAVLQEVADVVRSVHPGDAPAAKRGLFARFGGGRQADRSAPDQHDELDVTTDKNLYIPITSFGNVTAGDARRLSEALRVEAATWAPPELHFSGGAALEFKGDESVWVKAAGDVDGLSRVGRGVPQVVQRLGFFVDRRQFRPWLAVGTITETTTAPYLEKLVAALDGFTGQPWTQEGFSLMRWLTEGVAVDFEEMEQIPLGS